jgi:hypothetical protein
MRCEEDCDLQAERSLSEALRRQRLEADLQRAWSQDPVALMALAEPEKGTKKVQETTERPN